MWDTPLLEKSRKVYFVRPTSHEEWNDGELTPTADGWKTGLCSESQQKNLPAKLIRVTE